MPAPLDRYPHCLRIMRYEFGNFMGGRAATDNGLRQVKPANCRPIRLDRATDVGTDGWRIALR